jgi:hypothetical protein
MKSSFHSLIFFFAIVLKLPIPKLISRQAGVSKLNSSQSQSHIATDGQSINKPWCRAPSGAHDQIFITVWQLRSCFCGAPSLTRGRVCLLHMLLVLAQSSNPSPLGLAIIFYYLRFETFLFVASYDSQGHGGGIRPRLHTLSRFGGSTCTIPGANQSS